MKTTKLGDEITVNMRGREFKCTVAKIQIDSYILRFTDTDGLLEEVCLPSSIINATTPIATPIATVAAR